DRHGGRKPPAPSSKARRGPTPHWQFRVRSRHPRHCATGHPPPLLELPAGAHEGVRALLPILGKYQGVLGLGPLAQDLVDLARGLRSLRALLADPKRARFVAVTRAAALPLAETRRLVAALDQLDIALSAVLVNALTPPGCSRCRAAAAAEEEPI